MCCRSLCAWPPQKFHAYSDRRLRRLHSRHDNWPIKTGQERSSYLASDNYTVSSRWLDHVSTRPGGTRERVRGYLPPGRREVPRRRRGEEGCLRRNHGGMESTIPITWLRILRFPFSPPAPLSISLPLSSPSALLLTPRDHPRMVFLSTSCPLPRKSMRAARPLLNPVTHDWNIPRLSALIRGLCTGYRFPGVDTMVFVGTNVVVE